MTAPVFIPTLDRFQHFVNCVESLSQCSYACETDLIISIDYPPSEKYIYGWKLINDYVNKIEGFKNIKIFRHKRNLGAVGNWRFCVEYCQNNYLFYIGSEDDNIFSLCFLEYMNYMLDRYSDDSSIVSVSGYNHVPFYDQGEYTHYKSIDNGSWGVGYWSNKEKNIKSLLYDDLFFENVLSSYFKGGKIIRTYPMLYLMLYYMLTEHDSCGDVKRTILNIFNKTYQIKPSISLVRNCGNDGSGIHCSIDNRLLLQNISGENRFDIGIGLGPWNTFRNKNSLYQQCLPIDEYERNKLIKTINNLYNKQANPIYKIKKQLKCLIFNDESTCL